MCGIVGIVNKNGDAVQAAPLLRLVELARHRGPDAKGYHLWHNVGFGHARLRVIDTAPDSDQPFASDDGELIVTYNGEIYNYLEIRAELAARGEVFRTRSDTEVLLRAYRVWGPACVAKFNGMWAFAILDKRRRNLFCSRDRFGVKPFYYLDGPAAFAFASEQKQLVTLLKRTRPNFDVVVDFLFTQIADSDERTFFQDLRRLPPGHNLTYELDIGRASITQYYRLRAHHDLGGLPAERVIDEYSSLLESSVSLRMRSDVRVGTCLSGGLDSSSVATIASALFKNHGASEPFSAITAVSSQSDNNEEAYARTIVDHCAMRWIRVVPTFADFAASLERLAYVHDEPYGGPSIAMQYFVMRAAAQNGITVLLDGQGGDETLLGYEKYYPAAIRAMYRDKGIRATWRMLGQIIGHNANMSWRRIALYLVGTLSAPLRFRFYRHRHRYLRHAPPMPKHLRDFAAACRIPAELQILECTSTNLPVLLRYEDKNSMAHSVEARLPFLDYRLVEYAISLPIDLKIRDGWTKWPLRMAMQARMPSKIVWRKDKKGFEAPEREWLARHYATMFETVTSSALLARLSKPGALARAYRRLDPRSQWRLYSTALWERAFSVEP